MAKKMPTFACRDCGATSSRWSGRCSCGAMNSIIEISAAEAAMVGQVRHHPRRLAYMVEALEWARSSSRGSSGQWHSRIRPRPRRRAGLWRGAAARRRAGHRQEHPVGAGRRRGLALSGAVLYVTRRGVDRPSPRRALLVSAPRGRGCPLASSTDAQAIASSIRFGDLSLRGRRLDPILDPRGRRGRARRAWPSVAPARRRWLKQPSGHCALIIVGHVTKDGSLAGPRLLEHLVDTVLAFEGDRYADLRVLRAVKNRYGSTNEIGLFRMGASGLSEVGDPSGIFIADRDATVPGSCIAATIEGNRCLLVEVQALVNPTDYPQPVRKVSGLDPNRVAMVLAVLSRRERLPLGSCDVFVNATGGARVLEPAADLAIAMAIASAWREVVDCRRTWWRSARSASVASCGPPRATRSVRARRDASASNGLLGPGSGSGQAGGWWSRAWPTPSPRSSPPGAGGGDRDRERERPARQDLPRGEGESLQGRRGARP